jgi:peptide/nickel transport system ATP-binding protein
VSLDSAMLPATSAPRASDALSVEHVDVAYRVRGRQQLVLRDISFRIGRGESYGLVGESGCGKSTMALAIVRYLARNGRVNAGSIEIDGRDVLEMGATDLQTLRSATVSMVYQEPGRALNPSLRVGRQLAEVYELAGAPLGEARDRGEEMLRTVRIADPASVMDRYPHQLSGGMLQRVVIAMALAARPSLLILDEPTTALDATVEAEVLDLIGALRSELGTSLLFISHNLGVVAKMCDRVGVLYAGELVEEGQARHVFDDPRHPYTVGLLRCIPRRHVDKSRHALDTIPGFLPAPGETTEGCIFAPRCGLAEDRCRTKVPPLYDAGGTRRARCHFHERAQELPRVDPVAREPRQPQETDMPLVSMRGVSKTFHLAGHAVHALNDVDIEVMPGETLGLVGESGSGKTTLARVLMGLTAPDAGAAVELDGSPLASQTRRRNRDEQKALQIVFQNPDSALNRRHSVRRLIARSLSKLGRYSGARLESRLMELLRAVRLSERHLRLRPGQLSGGLKQRVAIARAFAGDPRVVVCDEPTSALDVSVQAAILNLLTDLQQREDVAYVFISHDLGVVRYLADRVAVMYLGRVMEIGPAGAVFGGPQHPYTEALLSAVPALGETDRRRIRLDGEIPSAADLPSGCPFHTRCPRKLGAICESTEPPVRDADAGHSIRCHIPVEELRAMQSSPSRPRRAI